MGILIISAIAVCYLFWRDFILEDPLAWVLAIAWTAAIAGGSEEVVGEARMKAWIAGGSMRVRQGLFRLWLVLSVIWIVVATWLFWDDLTGKLLPEEVAAQAAFPEGYTPGTILESIHERFRHALELVFLPPLGLLALGCAGLWVVRGFQPKPSS